MGPIPSGGAVALLCDPHNAPTTGGYTDGRKHFLASNIRAGDTQLLPGSAFPANEGWPTNKAFSSPTLRSKKSVSGAPRYSTFLLTPLSPPTQLLAAALCSHQCQCHCHHRAQRAPTLPLTFPLTKRVPRSFSCRLFQDMARSESKPCSPAVGNPPRISPG